MASSKQRALDKMLPAWAFAFGAAAFVGWVVHLLLPEEVTITSALVAIFVALAVFLYAGTVLHLIKNWPTSELIKPRVLLFKSQGSGLFLFSSADWLSSRACYSLFVTEADGFERILCVAEVFIVQDDKKVQLAVIDRADGADSVWRSLDAGSKDHFKSIIIKPGAPRIG